MAFSKHFKKLGYLNTLIFSYPGQNEVLIYDAHGSDELKRIVIPGKEPALLSVRGEWFSVHPIIIAKFFYNAFIRKLPLRVSYDLAYITAVKPILVITLIDNNYNFHKLSTLYKASFFCIQNGFRSHNCALSFNEIPTLFSFGQRDIDLYKDHNVQLNDSYPVGSIRSSYFLEEIAPKLEDTPTYDICFISEYLAGMENDNFSVTEEGIKFLHEWLYVYCEYLQKYLKGKNIRLVIAGRQRIGDTAGEVAFYRKYFDESVTILPSNKEYLNSYRVSYRSSLVLSYCSSLGFEAMTWGKKALFFPHPEEKNLALDNPKSIFLKTEKGTYEEFESKMNQLLSMSTEAYLADTKEDMNYIIGNARPAHFVIREKIQEVLVSHKNKKD